MLLETLAREDVRTMSCRFDEIAQAAYHGEEISGSLADRMCYEAMFSLYYAYHFGAVKLDDAKKRTQKIKHEYENAKAKEEMSLDGYKWMQAMYHAIGEVFRDYHKEHTIETAERLIAVINGKHDEWREEHE